MEKIGKVLDLLVVVLEMYAVKLRNEMEGKGTTGETEMEKAERKVRKTRTPKEEKTAPAEAPAPATVEDQLGLGDAPAPAPKVELTEKESTEKMEAVTKQFVILCKNDKPEDGKTRAIRMMQTDPRFKVGKLGDLTHPQRLLWIAEMEKGIEAHK